MKYSVTAFLITGILSLLVFAACGGAATVEPGGVSESDEQDASSESRESGGERSEGSESREHGNESESGSAGGASSESRESGGERSEGSELGEHGNESESGEHDEGNEESGAQYSLDETYDEVRAGARLIISYDAASNSFSGTVENTTEGILKRVRVEVHLSNGIELGPTSPVDLVPGEKLEVTLEASSQPFETWSAHPETG